jgi:hypothetical protein
MPVWEFICCNCQASCSIATLNKSDAVFICPACRGALKVVAYDAEGVRSIDYRLTNLEAAVAALAERIEDLEEIV